MEQPDSKRYSEETSQACQTIVTDWVYKEIRSFLGRRTAIKSIFIDLPATLASVVESYVKAGFFRSEPDILLAALSEFVRQNRIELKARFALKTLSGQRKKLGRSEEKWLFRRIRDMMAEQDRRILAEFTGKVCSRFPDARVWAYGSRARGGAGSDSDFDICIVLNQIDHVIDRWIRDIAWEIGFENDRVITTVLINKEQFEVGPMSESTLVANILREGVSA